MSQGVAAAGECDYLLFTDADIAFGPGTVGALVRAAVTDDRALVSQMALLRADTGWERWIVPAFVYFFAQLYPFRRIGRPGRPDRRGRGRLHAGAPERSWRQPGAWTASGTPGSTTSPWRGC